MTEKFDRDKDGNLSQFEIDAAARTLRIENEDKKQDAQRHMVWFALTGMIVFPILVLVAELGKFTASLDILGSIAPTYFVSVSAIVGAFFAKEGYVQTRMDSSIHVDQEI